MTQTTTLPGAAWRTADPACADRLMQGAIDLHCHSGPSMMPRYFDHYEAMQEASSVGMRALLIKDHYYSATPVTELLNKHFKHLGVRLLSGVPLNNQSGGLNLYAVEHGIKMGAKLVWMPTFSSANHIKAHHKDGDDHVRNSFPKSKEEMVPPIPLTILDAKGKLVPEVGPILDLIAMNDVVLSGGHLHISEIFPLFEEARKRGVKRLLVNHPTYIIGATHDDMRTLAGQGVYLEHSMCMFAENSKFRFYQPPELKQIIEAGTVERTILGSDLGQVGNPRMVDGFRNVMETCLDLGYSEAQVRKMTSSNAADLVGL
jgi:hypothetical protein